MESYFEVYKQMLPNSVKLSYKGKVTFDLIDSILHIISMRLDDIEENVNIKKKVYTVLMECLQNLCNYIEGQEFKSTEYDTNCAVLSVENELDMYKITTGNFIQNGKVNSLQKWLDQINDCSVEQLKQLYNSVLTNDTFSSKGGGGLGFLDIARKTNSKLNYKFQKVDEACSFFILDISITR